MDKLGKDYAILVLCMGLVIGLFIFASIVVAKNRAIDNFHVRIIGNELQTIGLDGQVIDSMPYSQDALEDYLSNANHNDEIACTSTDEEDPEYDPYAPRKGEDPNMLYRDVPVPETGGGHTGVYKRTCFEIVNNDILPGIDFSGGCGAKSTWFSMKYKLGIEIPGDTTVEELNSVSDGIGLLGGSTSTSGIADYYREMAPSATIDITEVEPGSDISSKIADKLLNGCDIQIGWTYRDDEGQERGHVEAVVSSTGFGGFSTYTGSSIADHSDTGGARDIDSDGDIDMPTEVTLICTCPWWAELDD